MTTILPALAVTVAAFCLWLSVRIINRWGRWAKWTLVVIVAGTPIFYVLSIGPVIFAATRSHISIRAARDLTTPAYYPLNWLSENGPEPIRLAIWWYADMWRPEDPGTHDLFPWPLAPRQ